MKAGIAATADASVDHLCDEGEEQALAMDQRLLSDTRQLLAAFKAIEPLAVRDAMMTIMLECISHLDAVRGCKEISSEIIAAMNPERG